MICQSWYPAAADYMLMMCCFIGIIIRSGGDCVSLQSDLDVLQEWADAWQMRFNALINSLRPKLFFKICKIRKVCHKECSRPF